MKYLIFVPLIFSILFFSCIEDVGKIGCGEITNVEFDKQDSTWILSAEDTIYYKSNKEGVVLLTLFENRIFQLNSITNCKKTIGYILGYSCNRKIGLINISTSRYDKKEGIVSNIIYAFSQMSDNLIPVTQQAMGYIDIQTNQPINTGSTQFVQTTKLGTHQIGDKTYENVFVIEDLNKNNVPEIDISKFYVNPSGILRIEFYDGEIWNRVD